MTIEEVKADIKRLAQIAVSESWTDRLVREACTVTGENYQYFLPRKYELLREAIRAIKQGSQSEIVS